jgi:competence protein ComEA
MAPASTREEVAPRDADLEKHTDRGFTKPSQIERFANGKKTGRNPMKMKHSHRFVASLLVLVFLFTALPALGAEARSKVINVNSADTSQLALLPRVGPSVAQRIVDYRKQNGPFKKPEDLMLVQGIGEKTFQLLKPYVAIAGETTLKEKVKGSKSTSGGSDSKSSKSSRSEGKAAAKKESR